MVNTLRSFFTARCPICHFRVGVRVYARAKEGFLGWFWIMTYECRGCNQRFRALSFRAG